MPQCAAIGWKLVAKLIHVDRSQLFRKCKELEAMSPSEYSAGARTGFA